jgi:Fur family transcriptional regulator, peroxide stress response regulator
MKYIIKDLKIKGITLTPQRMAIIEFLKNNLDHPTAEDIYKALEEKYPSMSIATVYSTLELLKANGYIQELSIRKRGKACFDFTSKNHHHFLCLKCDNIIDIESECINTCPIVKAGQLEGCKVAEIQAYLYGVCSGCNEKTIKKNNKK